MPRKSVYESTAKQPKKKCSNGKVENFSSCKTGCEYFETTLEEIWSALKEILDDYTRSTKVQEDQKEIIKDQSVQLQKLNTNLEGITDKLESSFDLGKSFIKLFKLLLFTLLITVLSFAAIIVYITQVDINTEFFNLRKAQAEQQELPPAKK